MCNCWMVINNCSLRCMLVLIVLLQTNFMLGWSLSYEGISLLNLKEKVVKDTFGALSSWNEKVEHANGLQRYAVDRHSRMRSRKHLNLLKHLENKKGTPKRDRNHHKASPPPSSPPRASHPPAHNSPPPVHIIPPPAPTSSSNRKRTMGLIVSASLGGLAGLIFVVGIYLWRSNKITDVAPWAAGLSGQLQKAFVTGIPKLKRSELETACEDFSNVVGSSSLGTIYKGTLSNGIEIAVISLPVTSAKDWSRNLERELRKKIETLSKVNHKNFVNLIGYCEEKKPFTRMLVFEYAPNGSLFEHLHVRESEHLDWTMRLRVAMGMSYCLEHMHQLTPPRTHSNLNSSSVNLSDDYAAKISDFYFWNEVAPRQLQHPNGILGSLSESSSSLESNVFNFGLVLLEIMTGQIAENNENWVSGFLAGEKMVQELVDPMLRRFDHGQLERISEVIRSCLSGDVEERPTMKDVTERLKEITGINRDKASPRLSPLWWAELEVCSVNRE